MDYYINNNGIKKGPYDIVGIIKQIHSGAVTQQTQISNAENGEFISIKSLEAFGEVFENLQNFNRTREELAKHDIRLGEALANGAELWGKFALSFTIVSGLVLTFAFALNKSLASFPAFANFPFISMFITAFFTSLLYVNFFGYVLFCKRSQQVDPGRFSKKARNGLSASVTYSALIAACIALNGVSPVVGLVGIVGLLAFSTIAAFVPFLVFDNNSSFKMAFARSKLILLSSGSEAIGVVLAAVALNIIVAIVPAIVQPQLFIFGLFISIPITLSSLAYIYDELFR